MKHFENRILKIEKDFGDGILLLKSICQPPAVPELSAVPEPAVTITKPSVITKPSAIIKPVIAAQDDIKHPTLPQPPSAIIKDLAVICLKFPTIR